MNHFCCRTFTQIIYIGLVGEPQRCDFFIFKGVQYLPYFFKDKVWLRIIDLTRLINEQSQFWSSFYEEPRIHADAMPADARSRVKNVNARMAICHADGFPNIHAEFFGKPGEFIGKRDIYVSSGVLHQFDHFSCGGLCFDDFTFDKCRVEVSPGCGRFWRNASNNARIFNEFTKDLSGQDSLW